MNKTISKRAAKKEALNLVAWILQGALESGQVGDMLEQHYFSDKDTERIVEALKIIRDEMEDKAGS